MWQRCAIIFIGLRYILIREVYWQYVYILSSLRFEYV